MIKISFCSENALGLTIAYDDENNKKTQIDENLHVFILALSDYLANFFTDKTKPSLLDIVPAYNSLTLFFKDEDALAIKQEVEALLPEINHWQSEFHAPHDDQKTHKISISFEEGDAPDLTLVADKLNMTVNQVIEKLIAHDYRLYMYGFLPGFAYLGHLDDALYLPRRDKLRDKAPAGSVMIAAGQLGILPRDSQTGWYVIGRTKQSMFDPLKTPPVPFPVGCRLRFSPCAK